MALRLTLDTNAIVTLADRDETSPHYGALSQLLELHARGVVELAVSTAARRDVDNDVDQGRRARTLEFLERLKVIPALGRWDVSRWDRGDVWASASDASVADKVIAVLRPQAAFHADHRNSRNTATDADHVVAHILAKRDMLITTDSGLLKKSDELLRVAGATVVTPAAALRRVRDGRSAPSDE